MFSVQFRKGIFLTLGIKKKKNIKRIISRLPQIQSTNNLNKEIFFSLFLIWKEKLRHS